MKHLALRIYKGTSGVSLDEYPWVSVGTVPATFCPIVPSLVDEPETWILVHRYDYTLYAYQVMREDMAYRQICLLVPADMRLSADDNPYGLLLELWGISESQGNPNILFEERLSRCVLEERMPEVHLPVMNGQQPASFCADSRMQVKALLMFSLYPQLANISHLEIGLYCATTVFLPIKARPQKFGKMESPLPKELVKPKVESPVGEEMKNEQTDKKRNKGKKIVYTFLLIAIAAGLGGIYKLYNKDSTDSGFVVTDSVESVPLKPNEGKLLLDNNSRVSPIINKPMAEVWQEEAKEKATVGKQERMKARKEILQLVNRKDLVMCREHPGWRECLTAEERKAIVMILTDGRNLRSKDWSPIVRKKLQRFMDDKWPFSSFEEIIQARHEIIHIISDESNHEKKKY
ncbi:hypothetical protein I6E10_05635 [Phocaeicola barnesiae]|uniref:hypothetical protein n=1 Tax=Phocaeicola barnesiae TaxID=376804 RepID=UPI001F24882F|nr:hypothetical protein [Phocaeicola barnesiae]MCF2598229.1 hypothetical protein [Phocaeicola barnesiae]